MSKLIWTMAVVAAGILNCPAEARAQGIQEGQWEMTMVTKMSGMDEEMAEAMAAMDAMSPEEKAMMQQMMGGMNVQMGVGSEGVEITTIQCLSEQDPIPSMEGDEDCQVTHTASGNTVTFKSICGDGISEGRMTYDGESMSGVITSLQTVDGEETEATITVSGQLLGPCP